MRNLFIILFLLPICVKSQQLSPFKSLGEDKVYHIIAGAYISTPVAIASKKTLLWGIGVSAVAAISKEVYDSTQPRNRFDVKDAAFTIVTGALCSTIIHFVKKKLK